MGKKLESGCKKCGSVVHVDVSTSSDQINIKCKNASAKDYLGVPEIVCKKCNATVAKIAIQWN